MLPDNQRKDLTIDTSCGCIVPLNDSDRPHSTTNELSQQPIQKPQSSSLSVNSSHTTPIDTCPTISLWHDSAQNPLNWSTAQKWRITVLLSAFNFNTLVTSTMVIPALSQITVDLHIPSDTVTQIILSIYPLAYVCGFVLWAPLSEVYGRLPVLHVAGVWYIVWNLSCGFAQTEAVMIIGRLFSGTGAAAALAISPGVLGDIWGPEHRGRSLAILSVIALMGLAVGGILGGVVADRGAKTWRISFWSTTVCNALLQIAALVVLKESHAPTIRRRRDADVSESTPAQATNATATLKTLHVALRRPFKLFWEQKILQLLTLYTGVSFGILYLLISTISVAFQDIYNQTVLISSLNFLSIGLGMTLGAQICAPITDYLYHRELLKCQKSTQDHEKAVSLASELRSTCQSVAEIRLVPFIPAVFITASGLLIYGWTLQLCTHWIGPNIGIALVGIGNQAMTQCTNAYVIDCFGRIRDRKSMVNLQHEAGVTINISASAMCAVWAAKSIGGFSLPLAAPRMVHALSWGWTFNVLAACSVASGLPVAVLLLWKGKAWRERDERRLQ